MTIAEACSRGASFEVDADSGDAVAAVLSWRNTHRHEQVVSIEMEREDEE